MKTSIQFLKSFTALAVIAAISIVAISDDSKTLRSVPDAVDSKIDNMGYWKKMAELGLAKLNPYVPVEKARFTGSRITESRMVLTENSPDVCITGTMNANESENSVFINPNDADNALNSNNSGKDPISSGFFGANDLYTFDTGETWEGEVTGTGGTNSGDPATAINNSGRWFVGFITSGMGQGVSYSDDEGETWTPVVVNSGGGATLDKNHMWIDNCEDSPYEGNLYNAWTPMGFSHANNNEIEACYSDDNGESWSSPANISSAVNAGNHNQGVNLSTGPDGEVYAVWSIYDSWPGDENALGFAKSLDGGQTWESAVRIMEDIRGIRNSETSKNMRVNSFPSMDVDISDGDGRGNIYVVWTNIGEPGVNQGPDMDIYMIRSEDEGETWSDPIRVNQDLPGQGVEHYFSWICCDPVTGFLSVVYYDDRNVGGAQCEVFCSNSMDQGNTWEDMKVSDVAFTPSPIPGLAMGYFGDYLGIDAQDGWVYPVWTDNRSGHALAYTSPYQLIHVNNPYGLLANVEQETGIATLNWNFNFNAGFKHFEIKRNGFIIGTTTTNSYENQLPEYGKYTFSVTAVYSGNMHSESISKTVQWGTPTIELGQQTIYDTVLTGQTSTKYLKVKNSGQLPLIYDINLKKNQALSSPRSYCEASGGCGPYIENVEFHDFSMESECDGYADYTSSETFVTVGNEYEVVITNGAGSPFDVCGVWVDWNQNGDFEDDYPVSVSGSPGVGPYTATFTPPPYAPEGPTRLRIRIIQTGQLSPCGDTPYGEVEDYSVSVSNWISIMPTRDTLEVADSVITEITVDGNKKSPGHEPYHMIFYSNDVNNPEDTVLYDLVVQSMLANASASPSAFCPGGSASLDVNVEGGSGTYTYTWTSDPEGYTSLEKNPTFTDITESTVFYVEVDDGTYQASSHAGVDVYPVPDVELGDEVTICQGNTYTFDAGPDFESYLWSNGSTEQSITVDTEGEYWVEVSNKHGCVNSDTIYLLVSPLPVVSLGNDIDICFGETHTFDPGDQFISYLWQDGSTSQTFTADETGIYWVTVTNQSGCENTDTAELFVHEFPEVLLGNDTIICHDQSITLDAGNPGMDYLWSTGDTTQTLVVDSLGFGLGVHEIWCEVTNEYSCATTATVNVEIKDCSIGINEAFLGTAISIYPNPNNGQFVLNINTRWPKEMAVRIYNATGTEVYHSGDFEVEESYIKHINLPNLNSGLYIVSFETEGRYQMKKAIIR